MSNNIPNQELRTKGIILRRTNYGEADRIINIITPHGKITAIAKSARKERSKLAGGIELFSLVDLNLHIGRSEFAIVTSAKMLKNYSNIIKEYSKMEFAAEALKKISQLAENSDNPDYFEIIHQVLDALNDGQPIEIVEAWLKFNLVKASGEEINLYRDTAGHKLDSEKTYQWDFYEKALSENANGDISVNEIKIMRLILTNKLSTLIKIKNIGELISPIFKISQGL